MFKYPLWAIYQIDTKEQEKSLGDGKTTTAEVDFDMHKTWE